MNFFEMYKNELKEILIKEGIIEFYWEDWWEKIPWVLKDFIADNHYFYIFETGIWTSSPQLVGNRNKRLVCYALTTQGWEKEEL